MELYKLGEDNMTENTIQEMVSLIDKKAEKLNIILSLKPKQKEAIEKEDIQDMETTLNKLQEHLNKINEIDSVYLSKLNKLKSELGIDSIDHIDNTKYPCIEELRTKLSEIKATLEAIKAMDDENKILLQERFEETKGKLRNLRKGQIMNKGYNKASYGTMFIDQKK